MTKETKGKCNINNIVHICQKKYNNCVKKVLVLFIYFLLVLWFASSGRPGIMLVFYSQGSQVTSLCCVFLMNVWTYQTKRRESTAAVTSCFQARHQIASDLINLDQRGVLWRLYDRRPKWINICLTIYSLITDLCVTVKFECKSVLRPRELMVELEIRAVKTNSCLHYCLLSI